MKNLLLTLNICAAIFLVSCNNKPSEKTTTTPTPETKTVQIKLADLSTPKDLVCGMPLEEGGVADTASYSSKLYGFCSAECKAEFQKSPDTYLAQQ